MGRMMGLSCVGPPDFSSKLVKRSVLLLGLYFESVRFRVGCMNQLVLFRVGYMNQSVLFLVGCMY